MGELHRLPGTQPQTLESNPALWAIVSAFADDPTRPLPRHMDDLLELSGLLIEASEKVRHAMVRVQTERMSGG